MSRSIIALRPGDRLVGATPLVTGEEDLVFITSNAQLLRFSATTVRPQGRGAGGVTGIRLAEGAHAVWFGAVLSPEDAVVVTVAGSSTGPDSQPGTAKVTPFTAFPAKGRATGGVRCQRFLKGEDILLFGWVGRSPARAFREDGGPVRLPDPVERRDGSGEALPRPIAAVGTGQVDTGTVVASLFQG